MDYKSCQACPTLLVFGGTGFVGTKICEEGINNGLNVFSVSRSGTMPHWLKNEKYKWASKVHWSKGDASKPGTILKYFQFHQQKTAQNTIINIVGVISCVGGFHWRQSAMEQKCGDCNISICKLAKKYGIQRFVFISRDKTNLKDCWYIFPYVIPGYYRGKYKAEKCVQQIYGEDGNGICLLSGFVSGTRYIFGWIPVPLYIMCACVQYFCPVIDRSELACAAVRFIKSNVKTSSVFIGNKQIPEFFL